MNNQVWYIQLLKRTDFVSGTKLQWILLDTFTIDELVEKWLMVWVDVEPRIVSPSITTTNAR